MQFLRVAYKGKMDNQLVVNVFHFKWEPAAGVTSPNPVIEDYLSAFYAPLKGSLTNRLHFTDYEVYIRTGDLWLQGDTGSLAISGEAGSDPLPYQSAVVLLGKVHAYRGFGRKFIPGLTEGDQSGTTISNGFLASMGTALGVYVSATVDEIGTLTPGIFCKDGEFRAFTLGIGDILIGSQRRRKPGVGA